MIIDYNPDDYEMKAEIHTCEFHKNNPGMVFAGCTCTANYSQVPKKKEEE